MAHIRQRANGQWQVEWRVGGGRAGKGASQTFDTKRQAVAFRGEVDRAGQEWPQGWDSRLGIFANQEASAPSLREWFLRTQAANHRAEGQSLVKYGRIFDQHVPAELGDKPVDHITREDVGLWINLLRRTPTVRTGKPLSVKSIRNTHGILSTAMKRAVEDGHCRLNPFAGAMAGIPHNRGEMTFLEPDEFSILLAAVEGHYQPLVRMLFNTGMRWSEATALHGRDINLKTGKIRVYQAWKKQADGSYELGDPKTEASRRSISILDDADFAWLESQERWPTDLLFRTSEGARITGQYFHQRKWKPALHLAEQMGLTKQPRIHDLRHSHASWLLGNGAPILDVSKRLGHAEPKTTLNIYGHLTVAGEERLIAAMAQSSQIVNRTKIRLVSAAG